MVVGVGCVTVLVRVPGPGHRNGRRAVKTGCAGTTSGTARLHGDASLLATGRRLAVPTTTSRKTEGGAARCGGSMHQLHRKPSLVCHGY